MEGEAEHVRRWLTSCFKLWRRWFFLKLSAIPHENSGRGVFVKRPIGAVEVVGYYYRSLVNSVLGKQKQQNKAYEEVVMLMTVEQFSK